MKDQIVVKMVLDAWHTQIQNADKLLDSLTDEQLQQAVAPNRNRGIYLLGHLIAVHDRMLPLLGFEKASYPQLTEPFLSTPDNATLQGPAASELRQYWKDVNAKLTSHFTRLQPEEWFQKHTSVSAEDFAKEPHRNKLNVVVNRTNHLAYHLGQLAFLRSKPGD